MSPTTTAAQERLIPEVPPDSNVEWVTISQIDYDDIGPAPEADLEEKIRAQGILTPLTLARKSDGRFELIAGRRRLRVARKLGHLSVPALVIENAGMTAVSALTDHATRRENPAADLAHIEALVARGASETAIHKATGLAVKTIRARMKLAHLVPALREAFDRGKLPISVAEGCARLTSEAQQALAAKLTAVGRLTQQDVKEAKLAARPAPPPMLDGFDVPTVDPLAAPPIPASVPRLTPELQRTCQELIALLRSERRESLAGALEGALARAGAS